MSSVVVRFPDGSKEFRFPQRMLAEGDVIWHDGERYRVIGTGTDENDRAYAVVEFESPAIDEALRSEEGAIQLEQITTD